MLEEGMAWWRVEMGRDGSVRACDQVEPVSKGDQLVGYVYVQANDRGQAVTKAMAWYERRKQIRRAADTKRNRERRERGLCRNCSKPVCAKSIKFCAEHLVKNAEAQRRWQAGETKRRTEPNVQVAFADAREKHKLLMRLRVQLPLVLEMFDNLSPNAFRRWVVDEIRRRGGEAFTRRKAA